MIIIFDMDNTIVDERGKEVRPGARCLLKKLKSEGHSLILWTSSKKARAIKILNDHLLLKFFDRKIFREDYYKKGARKDLTLVKGDIIVDDDPKEIEYAFQKKKFGILVQPFFGEESDSYPMDGLVRKWILIYQLTSLIPFFRNQIHSILYRIMASDTKK